MTSENTTIKLNKKTKLRLDKLKEYKRETYDEILEKMLEILTNEKKSLSTIIQIFPHFYMKKESFFCEENLKEELLSRILEKVKKRDVDINTIDGVRINYSDDSWILFKSSGTEPVFRIYSESLNENRVEELANYGSTIVKKILINCQK